MIALEGFEIEYPTTGTTATTPTDATGQTLVRADYDGHMDWDNGGFWVMLSVMAVFWLGLLAVIAWGVATYARKDGRAEESALEIARRRYARGEISAEEFERIQTRSHVIAQRRAATPLPQNGWTCGRPVADG